MAGALGATLALLCLQGAAHVQFGPAKEKMAAFVQHDKTSQSYVSDFPQPAVGDLHKTYGGKELPASCEVLIKVMASSVNPSDRYPSIASKYLPHVLGSDVAGVVAKVGAGCTTLKVGDGVWGDIGANIKLPLGKTKELGAYAEYAVALESQLWTIPTGMSFNEAGSLPKVALTSYKALVWYAGATTDALWGRRPTVLVLGGSGGTGTTGIQLAKAFGAGAIITTTSSDNFGYCKSLGATRTIDYKTENWWDASVIADNSVDVIYDCVGQTGTGDRAMAKIKTGGYYVTICGAMASKPKQGVKQSEFINSDTNLNSAALLQNLTALSEAGHLSMPAIQKVYPLSAVADAFAESATGTVKGKLVIGVANTSAAESRE